MYNLKTLSFSILLMLLLSFNISNGKEIIVNVENTTPDVLSIEYFSGLIICGCTNGILMISSDKGLTWESRKILPDSINIKIVKSYNKILYVASDNIIMKSFDGFNWETFKFDDKITVNIEIYNNSIFRLTNDWKIKKYTSELKEESLHIPDFIKPLSFTIYNNNIFFSFGSYLYHYNLDNNALDSISEIEKVSYFKIYEDMLYFVIGDSLFSIDKDLYISFIVSPVSYNYEIYNKNIYDLDIQFFDYFTSIFYYKFANNGKVTINNPYDTSHYAGFTNCEVKHIDNNIIIIGGTGKTIIRSSDDGVHWDYISSVYNNIKSRVPEVNFLNEKAGFLFSGKNIYKTSTGGINWLNQRYDDKYLRIANLKYPNHDSTTKELLVISEGFSIVDTNSFNTLYSNDSGNTYSHHYVKSFYYFSDNRFFNINNLKDFYIINFQDYNNDQIAILLDKSNFKSVIQIDKSHTFSIYKSYIEGSTLYAFGHNDTKNSEAKNVRNIVLLHSLDTGKTWIIDKILLEDGACQFPRIKGNKVLALLEGQNIKKFLSIDLVNQEASEIKIDKDIVSGGYGWVFGKIWFASGLSRYLIENNDFNNPVYSEIKLSDPVILSNYYEADDKTAYAIKRTFSGSLLTRWDIYKLTLEEGTPVAETQKVNKYLYISPSYPNPAKEYTKTTIAWDKSYSIDNASVEVYDMLQRRVSQPAEIEIAHINDYVGEIRWDCSKVPAGLYFIKISAGSNTRTSAVTVVK